MSNFDSLISIYIITYNRVCLLERCVQSIMEQTYDNIEIIIVNDCSSDSTSEYLKKISVTDKRIIIIENDKNMGACYSRNEAIKKARGKYITGVDDDDYFLKTRISDFWENKNLLDEFALLYTDSIWKKKNTQRKGYLNHFFRSPVKHEDLLYFNFIGNQVFTKTERLRDVCFDVNLPAWQDLECWYGILLNSKMKAKKIKKYNYVQDVSHEYERIGLAKKEKILQSYAYFLSKYNLDMKETYLLSNHLFGYGIHVHKPMTSIFLSIYHGGIAGSIVSLRNLKNLVANYLIR